MGWQTEAKKIRAGLARGDYQKKRNYADAFMKPFVRGIERQEAARIVEEREERARVAREEKEDADRQRALDKADAARQDMVSLIIAQNNITPTPEINKQLMTIAKSGNFTDAGKFQTYFDEYIKYDQGKSDAPLNQIQGSLPPEMRAREEAIEKNKQRILNNPENKAVIESGEYTEQEINDLAGDLAAQNTGQPDPASLQMQEIGIEGTDPSITLGKRPKKPSAMEEREIVSELNSGNISDERRAALENELSSINYQTDEEIFAKLPAVKDMKSFRSALAEANALPDSSGKTKAIARINQIGTKLANSFDQDFLQNLDSVDKITAAEGELEAMPEIYDGQKAKLEKILETQKEKFATLAKSKSDAKLAAATGSEIQLKRYNLDPKTGLMNFKVLGGTVTRKPDGAGGYIFTTTEGKPLDEETIKNSVFYTTDEAELIIKVYNDEVSEANTTITESTVAVATIIDLQDYVATEGKEALNPFTNALGQLADKIIAAGDAAKTIFTVDSEGNVGNYKQVESEFLESLGNLSGKDKVVAQKTLATAYAIAKMRGSVGQALSDRELKSILATLGQGVTNPEKLVGILDELLISEVTNAEIRRKGFSESILKVGGETEIINSTGIGKPIYGTILEGLEFREDKAKFKSMFSQQLAGEEPSRRPEIIEQQSENINKYITNYSGFFTKEEYNYIPLEDKFSSAMNSIKKKVTDPVILEAIEKGLRETYGKPNN